MQLSLSASVLLVLSLVQVTIARPTKTKSLKHKQPTKPADSNLHFSFKGKIYVVPAVALHSKPTGSMITPTATTTGTTTAAQTINTFSARTRATMIAADMPTDVSESDSCSDGESSSGSSSSSSSGSSSSMSELIQRFSKLIQRFIDSSSRFRLIQRFRLVKWFIE